MLKLDKVSGDFFYKNLRLSYTDNLNHIQKILKHDPFITIDLLNPDENAYLLHDYSHAEVTLKLFLNEINYLHKITLSLHYFSNWSPPKNEKIEALNKLQAILSNLGGEKEYSWGTIRILYDDWNKYYLLEICYSDSVIINEETNNKEKTNVNIFQKILQIFN